MEGGGHGFTMAQPGTQRVLFKIRLPAKAGAKRMTRGNDDHSAECAALYKQLAPGLRRYLQMRMGYNRGLAEDVLQETARIMWIKWEQVRDHPNPKAWLYMVAGRVATRTLRKELKRTAHEAPQEDMAVHPATEANNSEDSHTALREAVDKLSERQRQAVWLYYFHGFKQHEVAAIMQIKRGAVAALLFQARHRLEDLLGYQTEGQV
jgi:RNA polymerase sigma factor (sigma-70 family)